VCFNSSLSQAPIQRITHQSFHHHLHLAIICLWLFMQPLAHHHRLSRQVNSHFNQTKLFHPSHQESMRTQIRGHTYTWMSSTWVIIYSQICRQHIGIPYLACCLISKCSTCEGMHVSTNYTTNLLLKHHHRPHHHLRRHRCCRRR
jgi:hypothetical protein